MKKLIAPFLLLAACPAPPCDEVACRADCPGFAEGGDDVVQPIVISASEAAYLGDLIADVRKGPTADLGGSGLCGGGAGPCAAFVRQASDPTLGPGPHRLTLSYRTPKPAQTGDAWVEAKAVCLSATYEGGEPLEFYTTLRVPLAATEGRTERMEVTTLAEGITEGRCVWEMTVEGPQGERVVVEGEALIGAWASRRERLPEVPQLPEDELPEEGVPEDGLPEEGLPAPSEEAPPPSP